MNNTENKYIWSVIAVAVIIFLFMAVALLNRITSLQDYIAKEICEKHNGELYTQSVTHGDAVCRITEEEKVIKTYRKDGTFFTNTIYRTKTYTWNSKDLKFVYDNNETLQ